MALPIEVRHQALVLFQQGLRAKGIANRLGIGRSRSAIGNIVTIVVMIYGSRKPTITDGKIALQAVSLYTKLCSFSAVASALGLHSNSVQTYVSKMAVYGVAILSLPKLIQPFDGMRIAENWE